jgi:hypothetical protein
LTTGCVSQKTFSWDVARNASYRQHFRDWSRTDQIYDGIVARATSMATCLSPAFAGELQKERSKRARHDSGYAATKLSEAKTGANETLTFFVALHTQNHYWNDLERDTATFKVRLYADAKPAVAPNKIRRLNQNQMADWSTLFPTVGPLDTGYFISFSPVDGARKVRLLISGNPGAMEMVWKLSH